MKLAVLLAAIVIGLGSIAGAQPATPPSGAGLEPGEAESWQRATTAPVPKTWSHPATEIRGVWMASQDLRLTKDQIGKKLDALAAAHFNAVMIDTYFRGYVAYPGSEILPQFPEFHGDDVIGMVVDECHKRSM